MMEKRENEANDEVMMYNAYSNVVVYGVDIGTKSRAWARIDSVPVDLEQFTLNPGEKFEHLQSGKKFWIKNIKHSCYHPMQCKYLKEEENLELNLKDISGGTTIDKV